MNEPLWTKNQLFIFALCAVGTIWTLLVCFFISMNVEMMTNAKIEVSKNNAESYRMLIKELTK